MKKILTLFCAMVGFSAMGMAQEAETTFSGSKTGTITSEWWEEIAITETELFGSIKDEATYIEFTGNVSEVHYNSVAGYAQGNAYTSVSASSGVAIVDATDILTGADNEQNDLYFLVVGVSLQAGATYNIYWTVHTAEYVPEEGVDTPTVDTSSWNLAFNGFDASWGGWSSVASDGGVLSLTGTVHDVMEVNGITEISNFGGFIYQIWNNTAGAIVSWTLTITNASGEVTIDESGELTLTGSDNCIQLQTTATGGSWDPAEDDIIYGTVEVIGFNAIKEIKSDVEAIEVARYNLLGQKLSGEQKGINIIVYSDGSSKKVLVK